MTDEEIEISPDLESWQPGGAAVTMLGQPVDLGDGTEIVTYRTTSPASEEEPQYLRVRFLFP